MTLQFPARKYEAVVRAGTWFQAVPASLQEQLLELAIVRNLNGGQRLFARGDAADGLYCVVEGSVRITGMSSAGKEALLAIVEQPHWFGEIALFDGQPRTHDAWAASPTVLLHVSHTALIRLLDAYPVFWRDFGLLLTQKIRMTFMVLEEFALLPAAGRLARRLVTMAEGYGEWKDRSRRLIQVPQDQLALMLALSRQTVNQILKELEAQDAIPLVRGGIEILDLDKLRCLAE